MSERPILFNGPMVRAILEGHKTQTRRPLPDPAPSLLDVMRRLGAPKDRLWVRETWRPTPFHLCGAEGCDCDDVKITYPANNASRICTMAEGWTPPGGWRRYDGTALCAPSIHMPRWASRLTLEVTGVRVERLQDISEEDALAEGVGGAPEDVFNNARDKFAAIWRDCYGAESWTSNPWVVVRAFVPVTS